MGVREDPTENGATLWWSSAVVPAWATRRLTAASQDWQTLSACLWWVRSTSLRALAVMNAPRHLLALAGFFTSVSLVTAQDGGRILVSDRGLPDDASFTRAGSVSVLDREDLILKLDATLGDTLRDEPGISSSYYGPAAGKPIIRGLDGQRVRVLVDGTGVFDGSSTGPDHGTSVEALSASRIEIYRGPSAVLFGSGAIGGVVNVVTNRIPETPVVRPLSGTVDLSYGSAGDARAGGLRLEGGANGWTFHLDAAHRTANDYGIPGFKRSAPLRAIDPLPPGESENRGTLPDSSYTMKEIGGGISYAWSRGFIGVSAAAFHNDYAVPNAEAGVRINLNQRRFDLRGQFDQPFAGIRSIRYAASFGSFSQGEQGPDDFAGPAIIFQNRAVEGRLEVRHEPIAGFNGVLGYQLVATDFEITGEQSFQPLTRTRNHGIFLFEEKSFAPFRVELGVRYEHQDVNTSGPGRASRSLDTFSAAAGLVYLPNDDWSAALNLSYTQRPPTGQELFSNGPYVDIGRFVLGDAGLGTERSVAVEAALRKRTGWVTGSASFFFYRFQRYVTLLDTGAFDDEFGVAEARYGGVPADFIGGEFNAQVHLLGPVTARAAKEVPTAARKLTGKELATPTAVAGPVRDLFLELRADYTHAENRETGTALPRIPPLRLGAGLGYTGGRFSARIDYRRNFRQDRIGEFELPTPAFNDLSASAEVQLSTGPVRWTGYVKGSNLTNADQRLHTSFIKDFAPLAGRAVTVGLRASF